MVSKWRSKWWSKQWTKSEFTVNLLFLLINAIRMLITFDVNGHLTEITGKLKRTIIKREACCELQSLKSNCVADRALQCYASIDFTPLICRRIRQSVDPCKNPRSLLFDFSLSLSFHIPTICSSEFRLITHRIIFGNIRLLTGKSEVCWSFFV